MRYERTSDGGLRTVLVTAEAAQAAYDITPENLRDGDLTSGFTVYRLVAPRVRVRSATYTPLASEGGI